MTTITIAGADPAFKNTGLSKGKLDLNTGEFQLEEVLLVSPTKPKNHKQLRTNSVDLDRARELHNSIHTFLVGVDIICVELPVGSQSASGMKAYGVCIGLFASVKIPIIQVTASEVKLALSGDKNASKQTMIQCAVGEYPNANWLTRKLKGKEELTAANEHIADSIGAIHAGVLTDQFKMIQQVMRGN